MKPLAALATRAAEARVDALEALGAIRDLQEELERLEVIRVREAVQAGHSWSEVAEALGVSKQAAHKKHAERIAEEPETGELQTGSVLVTSEARSAVRHARAEARRCGERQVGTEHLLLGILSCDYTVAVRALDSLGVALEPARDAVATTIVDGRPRDSGEPDEPAISDAAREALEGSLRETLERGEGYLGVEHLLLSLLRDPEGGAARTLDAFGVGADDVRRRLDETVAASLSARA